jgi:predicted phosphodiesterase
VEQIEAGSMRLAFLADIHSNLPALEAVVTDLRQMAPDQVFLAGDQINRCPWPNEVMALINDEGWPVIYGNHELVILELGSAQRAPALEDRKRFADLWWTREHLAPKYFDQLEEMPGERRIVVDDAPPILLMHGLAGNPFEGFSPQWSDSQIGAKLQGIDEPVVVSAHTHWPLDRTVRGQRVINPGSVGMPYNGDPRAQYALLDTDGHGWQPSFRQVAYDHEVVREAFERLGLFHEYGPLGPLFWQTIETGDPWVSDFLVWLRGQEAMMRADLDSAVTQYLAIHGPGKWAFDPR